MIELKDLIALITVCATMIAGLCLLLFKNLKVRVDVLERDCVNVQKECAGKPHISLERLERKIEESEAKQMKLICGELSHIKASIVDIQNQRTKSREYGEYYFALMNRMAMKMDVSLPPPPG